MSETAPKEMPKTKQQLDRLIQNLSGLIETRLKLFRLEMEEELSGAMALLITLAVILLLAGIAGLFLSIALALALGSWLGSHVYGFLAVAAIYILLLLIINNTKKTLKKGIRKGLEQQWSQLSGRVEEKTTELLEET